MVSLGPYKLEDILIPKLTHYVTPIEPLTSHSPAIPLLLLKRIYIIYKIFKFGSSVDLCLLQLLILSGKLLPIQNDMYTYS